MIDYTSNHWKKFEDLSTEENIENVQKPWKGCSTVKWAGYFNHGQSDLPSGPLDRKGLKAFLQTTKIVMKYVSCMAWGGIQKHGESRMG